MPTLSPQVWIVVTVIVVAISPALFVLIRMRRQWAAWILLALLMLYTALAYHIDQSTHGRDQDATIRSSDVSVR